MRSARTVRFVVATLLCLIWFASVCTAAEKFSILGKVMEIDMEKQTVLVKPYVGEEVLIRVEDEVTIKKLTTGRIKVGDEVKVKYVIRDGLNVATYFRKPAGC